MRLQPTTIEFALIAARVEFGLDILRFAAYVDRQFGERKREASPSFSFEGVLLADFPREIRVTPAKMGPGGRAQCLHARALAVKFTTWLTV